MLGWNLALWLFPGLSALSFSEFSSFSKIFTNSHLTEQQQIFANQWLVEMQDKLSPEGTESTEGTIENSEGTILQAFKFRHSPFFTIQILKAPSKICRLQLFITLSAYNHQLISWINTSVFDLVDLRSGHSVYVYVYSGSLSHITDF